MGVHRNCADHVAGPQRRVGVAKFETLLTPPKPGKWPARPTALTFDDKDPPCEYCTTVLIYLWLPFELGRRLEKPCLLPMCCSCHIYF